MKNSVPSDVWEKKRALITKLYKDEEWPLKQVIKQIRSEDFNPSETQLRSRLKKWRVTKPYRQTRKKSHDGQRTGNDSGPVDTSSKDRTSTASPSTQKSSQPAVKKDASSTEVDWHPVSLEEQQDLSNAWAPSHYARDLSHSPSMMNQFPGMVPSPSSYGPSQPSTPVDGVLLNPSTPMAPPYSSPKYTVAPDVCLPPSSTSGTAGMMSMPWSVPPPWFSVLLDGVPSQSHSVPFYTAATCLGSPVAGSPEQTIPSNRIYSSQSMTYPGPLPQGMSEVMGDAKQWRRAMSLQCNSSDPMTNASTRDRPRAFMERKASMLAKPSNTFELVSQYYPNAQPPLMRAPLYPYPDQESDAQAFKHWILI